MRVMVVLCLGLAVAGAEWVSIGPDGGYVQALAVDPARPQTLFAASYDYPDSARLFRSDAAGNGWEFVGVIPYTSVSALRADPRDSMFLYAPARGDLLFRTSDRGRTWRQLTLPGYASTVEPDPHSALRLYAGGYYYYNGAYRAALYVSSDRGLTWAVSMPRPDTVFYAYACAADPTAAGRVYLGSNSGYLHVTTDAGMTWQPANAGIPSNASLQGLSVNRDGSAVLAATSAGIYRSTDDGTSWSLSGGGVASAMSAEFSPGDASRAWALGRADSMRVFASTDGGANWERPVPGYVTSKVAGLVPDPGAGTSAYLSTQTGIYRSTNMGADWQAAHTGLRIAKISTITAGPWWTGRAYLEVSENGVFKTTDRGTNWVRCADFLSCGNICGIGVDFGTDVDVLYALEGSG
ncbi:hypothetical protein FJY71_09110 [candidate division WOR-3 bacterium]|nr:hypothetical protein [candidate division WOR-3 bacterium]